MWRPSTFNFAVCDLAAENGGWALYNSASGALTKLDGTDSQHLAAILGDPTFEFEEESFSADLFETLRSGDFVVPAMYNEIDRVRERFWKARGGTPAVLTITTTMDCNLGCYYCYEERSNAKLQTDSIAQIIELIDRTVFQIGRKSLHVDWYGGEPLLNFKFLNDASAEIQSYCLSKGIQYRASIISNGTMWPDDPVAFILRNGIRQVQISFDGMRTNHDKRRRTRKGFLYPANKSVISSFDEAIHLVDILVGVTRVDVRFNIDRNNSVDLLPFLDMIQERGWFNSKFPAVFQPARLAAYSNASSFMRAAELTLEEFDGLRALVRARLDGVGKVEESESPDGYPYPKGSVCAALSNASNVVGADGELYRCGLQVGEAGRSIGNLSNDAIGEVSADGLWWSSFDPTGLATCGKCSFLPICWGGCPKKHLERDEHAIAEQGRYWRTNLPRLIAHAAGISGEFSPQQFSDDQQFKTTRR